MKKILFISVIISLMLTLPSCKRSDVNDPSWDGPAGFYILVEGSVNPAVLLIDGRIRTSEIYIRVVDSKDNPMANETVFIEQLADSLSQTQLSWGHFSDNKSTAQRVTDGNGAISVTFYWPTQYYSNEMWIHALLVTDGRAYRDSNVPQDYIRLTMYRAGGAAPGTAK
jgi:hypothetical protein